MRFRAKLAAAASISTLAVSLSLALTSPAFADGVDATLRGHVDGAAAGSTVVAVDLITGHKTSAAVDNSGDYIFLGLRPSSYRIEVAGRAPKEAVLQVGQTVAVDFANGEASSVVVRGKRARQEIVTQEIATNVTPAQIENLPQNARNFLSFATLAPGIQLSNPSGAAQIQAGALSPDQTNVFIDGVSFKNLTNHGGVFGQNFGQGGNPFPQSAVQEYQIETQNFGAETGQAGTAVINAITKTGGNDFHGSAFIDFQPKDFIEQPHFDKLNGVPKPKYNRNQYGAELGGPIIRDKLNFFFSAEGTSENLPGSTGSLPASAIGYPANVASAVTGVPHSYDFTQNLYFGKLTYYATPNDTLNFSTYYRKENNLSDVDSNAASTHARNLKTQVTQFQLTWKRSVGNTLNLLNVAYNDSSQSTPTAGSGPEYNLTNGLNFGQWTGAELGAHFFTQADTQKSLTFKDDFTYRLNDHKIKLGGQVILNKLTRNVTNAFNGRYYFNNPGSGVSNFDPTVAIPYGAQINTLPFAQLSADDNQVGLYIQDEWKKDEHLTLNYGLRWDYESNANNNDYVTPANIVTALNAYTNWTAAGIKASDYISTGSNRKPQWDQFQPRLGFSYDVHGDKDLIIFGGAGRYYDRSLFIEGVIESLTNNSSIPNINFTTSCAAPLPANTLCWSSSLRDPNALRTAVQGLNLKGGDVWLLPNKIKAPYSDEFDLGVRKRFGEIQTSMTLSYVNSQHIFQYVRGNRLPNGAYTAAGNTFIQDSFAPCGQLGWNGLGWNSAAQTCDTSVAASTYNGKLNIGQSSGQAHLLALYIQVEKPFTERSNWGFISSLTIQKARTNDATPSIFDNDENYNGPSQNAYGWGNVPGVPSWIWNTSANYRFQGDWVLSATLQLNSGPSFGNINFGQTPSGTPIPAGACCYANFLGVYWPKDSLAYKRLDLKLSKAFKMPYAQGHELTVYFEAFNVFNWLNRNYSAWNAGSGTNPPLVSNWDGQVSNDQRQFQAGLKYKF